MTNYFIKQSSCFIVGIICLILATMIKYNNIQYVLVGMSAGIVAATLFLIPRKDDFRKLKDIWLERASKKNVVDFPIEKEFKPLHLLNEDESNETTQS